MCLLWDALCGEGIGHVCGFQRDAAQDAVHVFRNVHFCSSPSPQYMLNI